MRYYAVYNKDTGEIIKFHVPEIHGENIPTPNIQLTDEEWSMAMSTACMVVDGKLQKYELPDTEASSEPVAVADDNSDKAIRLNGMLIQTGEAEVDVVVKSVNGVKTARGSAVVNLNKPYKDGKDEYGEYSKYYIYANIVSPRAFNFVLNVNNADMLKKNSSSFVIDITGSSTIGSLPAGSYKVGVVWMAVGAAADE